MSQCGHRGWGWFPSSRITMLYRGCRWENCIRSFVREDSVPRHPSTGNINRARIIRKDTLYCAGVPSLTLPYPPPPWGGGEYVTLKEFRSNHEYFYYVVSIHFLFWIKSYSSSRTSMWKIVLCKNTVYHVIWKIAYYVVWKYCFCNFFNQKWISTLL